LKGVGPSKHTSSNSLIESGILILVNLEHPPKQFLLIIIIDCGNLFESKSIYKHLLSKSLVESGMLILVNRKHPPKQSLLIVVIDCGKKIFC
jgi:hypothetical protein